ncbi:MAG: phosphatidylserine decarboxylase [Clostridia bacterium]|nr:phosphatidylserine decarboxylase [Clostridia bacterium]
MASAHNNVKRAVSAQPEAAHSLKFLYRNPFGRVILGMISGRAVSKLAGKWMSSRFSRGRRKRFIAANGIDMSEYPEREYRSFNDFFTREIKHERRPVDADPDALCSPCDSALTVYRIEDGLTFEVKNSRYSVADMLGDRDAASEFDGGYVMVFRLAVNNYHRVCFFDGGDKGESRFIPGRLHTVQAIATDTGHDIYARNCRSVCYIDSDSFGRAAMVYVGALLVGRIVEHKPGAAKVARGEEAGMFLFGGSTVVLVIKKGAANIDRDILDASRAGLETAVKYGEAIGRRRPKDD